MNLVDEAESLMLYQFKNAPKLKALLRSLIHPVQTIAPGIEHFSDGVHIDQVSGHWLDVVGDIVGQSRLDMSDDDFRTWLKIRIKLNRCNGTPEEIISIIRLLCGPDYPLTITEYHVNDVVIILFAPLTTQPETVFTLIEKASPPGFKRLFVNATATNPFRFDHSSFSESQFADFF